jgi:hypothetical protein
MRLMLIPPAGALEDISLVDVIDAAKLDVPLTVGALDDSSVGLATTLSVFIVVTVVVVLEAVSRLKC